MQLLVASAGGHLTQLLRLRHHFAASSDECAWVTYDSVQGRELRESSPVIFGHGPSTRSLRAAVGNHRLARRLLGSRPIERIISTGAGIAVPFLTVAARHGVEAVYVESATRTDGPSLSGRMLERIAGVSCYSQWAWARRGWHEGPWVFDAFTATTTPPTPVRGRRILVTLGTHPCYRFERLVEQVARVRRPTDRVVWQTGATPVPAHVGRATGSLRPSEFERLVDDSDVVIGHAGIGTAIKAMERGKFPILVPRRRQRGEHVDDHQVTLARLLDYKGLALAREPCELRASDLDAVAGRRILDAIASRR
jgi:UDP-N-acetylglucosamine transferase subunit ALG13